MDGMDLEIFGRHVAVERHTTDEMAPLMAELALYREADSSSAPGFTLHLRDELPQRGASNPSLHIEGADGFVVRAPTGDIRFVFANSALTDIEVAIRPDPSPLRTFITRGRNIQFATPRESAGQTIHEMALVPALFFDPAHFALHSSAFRSPDGGVTLVGGTGGVGKTSLALELCRNRGFRFLADDISVVSTYGHVWPNLAFPKIYRYNVTGTDLYETLFAQASVLDRLQWRARGLLGADKVRRRVSPVKLYGGYSRTGGPLTRYAILMRDDGPAIRFQPIDARTAARMSGAVIAAEFWHFVNHLHWHRFNRLGQGREPVVHPVPVFERWEAQAEEVLQGCELVLCRVPRQMDLETLKREFTAWLDAPR